MSAAAFYCMSSEEYFLGAVGMINSLRLQGHDEPIYLLDLGLSEPHRELLAREATVIPAPADTPPWLAKTVAPLAHPAEAMVLIDSDMIVTRPLGELFEAAADGRVVAFVNDRDRWVPEWGEVLELGELERRPYLCSGLVALGRDPGEEVLGLVDERQRHVAFERTYFARDDPDYPLRFLDQDVLNAVLAARVERERVAVLDEPLAATPPFAGLRVVDEQALRCRFEDGREPYVVHHYVAKPWIEPTHHGVYSRLLHRCLVGPDLALEVPRDELPLRFRTGPLAFAERKRVDARERLRYHLVEPLGERLTALRARGGEGR